MSVMFTIRPVQPDDAPALAVLLQNLDYFERLQKLPLEEVTQTILGAVQTAHSSSAHTLLVAVHDDARLIGYCAVHWIPILYRAGPEGYVSELFVDKSMRGQGVGRALLEAATFEARQRNCSKMQLINFRDRDSYQRGFYAKNSWEERPDAANFAFYLD